MRVRRAAVLAAVAALAVGVAACGDDDDNGGGGGSAATTTTDSGTANVAFRGGVEDGVPECYPEPQPKKLTIGYANPLDANETINTTARAMKLETEKLGGRFVNVDAKGDLDQQVSAIEQLIARKVDAIIVYPLDRKGLDPALKRAKAAGIPTIGIDANLDSTDPLEYTSQVWMRNDQSAYIQAKEATRLMGPGAEYVQAGFAVPVPVIEELVERAKFWGDKFGIKSLGRANNPTDDIAGGEKVGTQLLAKYPDAKGLIAYNEETATGASSSVRAQGKRDYILIGMNGGSLGFESVRNGKIHATVQQDIVGASKCAVWGAYDAVEGKKIPPTVLAGPAKLINKDTIGNEKTWNEQLEETYGKTQ